MPHEWIMEAALRKWGEEKQLLMVVEEMGELSHEILKYLRAHGAEEKAEARNRIAGEHADVLIMLDQLAFMMGQYDTVTGSYREVKKKATIDKVLRLTNRLEGRK